MNKRQNEKKENKLELIQVLNPPLEYIIQLIIKSRIKNISEDNFEINYPTETKNKLIDLKNYDDSDNPYNFEYNIYVCFCGEQVSILNFIVENWKFKISLNPEFNTLRHDTRKKLNKKFHMFARIIQSLQCLLPLNGLIKDVTNKNLGYSFKVEIFKKSNIEMNLEKEIKTEKRTISLEMKEDKYVDLQLVVNYYTRNGILKHKDNLKKRIDYNGYYTKFFQKNVEEKTKAKIIYDNQDDFNNNDNENDNNESMENFSQLCNEVSKNKEIMLSNIIQNSMIEKNQPLNVEDIKQIKKDIKNKSNINFKQLYSSSLQNIEDINCTKNIDEILDISTLMGEENILLNNINYNYNLVGQKQLIDEIYEEMEGIEIKDLMRFPPKLSKENKEENSIIVDDMKNKNKMKNNYDFKDLVNDYFDMKHFLIDKKK